MPRASTAISGTSADKQEEAIFQGIEQFELQKTIVTKMAKGALPSNIKLQKDVISAISKSASVFINYLAATAHETSVHRNVKTISASDVLKAVTNADFYPTELVPLLAAELEAYRALTGTSAPTRKRKSSVSESAAAAAAGGAKKKAGPTLKLKLNGAGGGGKGKEKEVPVGTLAGGDEDEDDDDDDEEEEEEEEDEEDVDEEEEDEGEEEETELPGAKGLEEGDEKGMEDSDGE